MARQPNESDDEDDPLDPAEPQELGGDAGQFDDAGGDGETGDDDQGREAEEGHRARPANRITQRYDEISRAARDASDRAARLEQELMQLRSQMSQPRQESEAEFEARLSLQEPQEQIRIRLQRAQIENTRQNEITRMQAADMIDRTQYDTNARHDIRYAKYRDKVEQLRLQELQRGNVHSRENLLTYILGQEVLKAQPKVAAAREQARERVQRQQARPGESRSDQGRERRGRLGTGNTLADLEHRLKDVKI